MLVFQPHFCCSAHSGTAQPSDVLQPPRQPPPSIATTNKQTNKPTNKQTNQPTNQQTNTTIPHSVSFSMTINKNKNLFPTKKILGMFDRLQLRGALLPWKKTGFGVSAGVKSRYVLVMVELLPPWKNNIWQGKITIFQWGMDIHLHSKMVGIFAATQFFVFFWAGNNGTSICTNISPCILSIHAGSHRPFVPWMCHGEIETWQFSQSQSTVQVPKPRDFFTEQLGGWILPVSSPRS